MRHALIGIGSFLFPGLGHGIAGHRNLMLAWALGSFVVYVPVIFTVWFVPVALLVQIAGAIDAAVKAHRAKRAGLQSNTMLALVAVGISIAGGFAVRPLMSEAFKIPSSSMYPTLEIGDHVLVDKVTKHMRTPERGEIIVFWQPCQSERAWIKRVIAVAGDTLEVRCNIVYLNGKAVPSTLVRANAEYKDLDESSHGWFARHVSHYRETIDGRTFDTFHDADRPTRDEERRTGAVIGGEQPDFPRDDGLLLTCNNQSAYESRPSKLQLPGKLVQTVSNPTDPCKPHMHFVVPDDSFFVMGDHRNNANDSRYWGVVPNDNVIGRAIGIWWPLSRAGGID